MGKIKQIASTIRQKASYWYNKPAKEFTVEELVEGYNPALHAQQQAMFFVDREKTSDEEHQAAKQFLEAQGLAEFVPDEFKNGSPHEYFFGRGGVFLDGTKDVADSVTGSALTLGKVTAGVVGVLYLGTAISGALGKIKGLGQTQADLLANITGVGTALADDMSVVGTLDIHAYHDGATDTTNPYGELWVMKPFPGGFTTEAYLETIAQDGDIVGIYGELTPYYDFGQHFGADGLAVWAEGVVDTMADDTFRGGLMWSGSAWENSFLMLRAGYGEYMVVDGEATEDATLRLIFNQQLPHGFFIGALANSGSVDNQHFHGEIPRIGWMSQYDVGVQGEVTIDTINGEDPTFGVRGGLEIQF